MCGGGYVLMSALAQSSQKGAEDLLELELWVVVSCLPWVLGTKFSPLQEQLRLLTSELGLHTEHAAYLPEAYCITPHQTCSMLALKLSV